MRKRTLLLFFLIHVLSVNLPAQIVVEGKIVEKSTNKPVSDVIVTVGNLKGTVNYAFGFANKEGKYRLPVSATEDSLSANFSLLGYESKTVHISNANKTLNVELDIKDFQIQEVKVKPPDIYKREDTLNFRVDAFSREQDRNIGEVLRRLPGVEVTASGTIKYNGENINNYYIEGLNLLGNKYSIANNNISPQDIANIQIIEYHQPVKILKGMVHSEQAAINLQLKEDKIAKPTGNTEIGSGFYPLLWNLNTFAMQIGRERQTIITYKTNNAGKNIAADLNPHNLTLENIISGNALLPDNLITPAFLNSPPTKQERYLFNQTHLVSINHLRKTEHHSQLRLNINYLNNNQKQKLKEKSTYYFATTDTNLVIDESNILDRYSDQGEVELTYTHNSPQSYINDALKFSGLWNSSQSSVTGYKNVGQKFSTPLFYIQNDWSMIKKMQSRIFQFSSFIRYTSLPQQLEVKIDSLSGEMVQDVKLGNFYTNNSTAYGFLWKKSSIRFDFNFQAFLDELNSSMDNAPLLFETDNHIKSNKWIYKVAPKYNYHTGDSRFNFELLTPISLNILSVNNLISESNQNFTFVFADPSASLSYKWNNFWYSDLSYKYTNDIGDAMNFTDAYIMANYRSFQRNSGILSRQTVQSGSFKVNYRNQIEALFFNFGITYRSAKSNLLSKTDFTDIYSLSSMIEANRRREYWIVNGNISKYVSAVQATFSINTNYTNMLSQYIQQGSELVLTNRMLSVRPKIDLKVNNALNLIYNLDFTNNKTQIQSAKADNPNLNQVSQYLTINTFPAKQWRIKTRLEYYQSRLGDDISSRLFFADLGIVYKTKKIEYSLDWTNIFDRRSYSYIRYDGPNIFSSNFDLRPMNFLVNIAFKF